MRLYQPKALKLEQTIHILEKSKGMILNRFTRKKVAIKVLPINMRYLFIT